MNIFYLDSNPELCAKYHCDKHVIKMILESVQILSAILRINNIDAGYKLTHKKHPATIWAGESLSNWRWVKKLTEELNKEYRYRYEKDINHKSFDVMQSFPNPPIEDKGLTKAALVMPEEYFDEDPVKAYRNYYFKEKANICSWARRGKPFWWMELEKSNSV